MKTGLDAIGTAQIESGSAKHENGTRRPQYRRKHVWVRKTWKRDLTPSVLHKTSPGIQKMQRGADAHGTFEKASGSARDENDMQRHWYRQKLLRVRKT
jgi:hypothetical protein